jgi:hypothetical protein
MIHDVLGIKISAEGSHELCVRSPKICILSYTPHTTQFRPRSTSRTVAWMELTASSALLSHIGGAVLLRRCPQNARILLVNLLPRDTVVDAASNTLCAWAFHDGIREAQFSALWG